MTIEGLPYAQNQQICNILIDNDCINVKNGIAYVTLYDGESKIYEPRGTPTNEPSYWLHYALIGIGMVIFVRSFGNNNSVN